MITYLSMVSERKLCDSGSVVTTHKSGVHSKLMIIDDRATLIGSSNIHDRCLLGSRDSEIGVLIEDEDWVESSMNGEPWRAGKFGYSLRISLWLELLGLNPSESTNRDVWMIVLEAAFWLRNQSHCFLIFATALRLEIVTCLLSGGYNLQSYTKIPCSFAGCKPQEHVTRSLQKEGCVFVTLPVALFEGIAQIITQKDTQIIICKLVESQTFCTTGPRKHHCSDLLAFLCRLMLCLTSKIHIHFKSVTTDCHYSDMLALHISFALQLFTVGPKK
ncbi:hypothetical protein POM88_046116 [Heracleum sosnowskyi]|uniref:phospholipase D n=1 Tax=Heracleum sosnowskyi TaxID=360622 RepID=A0AAD8H5Q6_9APIA|nr:hypothetical protein POM88_046116 [Heracleum sosnowskyi]